MKINRKMKSENIKRIMGIAKAQKTKYTMVIEVDGGKITLIDELRNVYKVDTLEGLDKNLFSGALCLTVTDDEVADALVRLGESDETTEWDNENDDDNFDY